MSPKARSTSPGRVAPPTAAAELRPGRVAPPPAAQIRPLCGSARRAAPSPAAQEGREGDCRRPRSGHPRGCRRHAVARARLTSLGPQRARLHRIWKGRRRRARRPPSLRTPAAGRAPRACVACARGPPERGEGRGSTPRPAQPPALAGGGGRVAGEKRGEEEGRGEGARGAEEGRRRGREIER
ncbi:hypothetical protein PVAP13_4KG166810 [Panicum virgatum]|uniref:Uncharacterized protein n=1 Tax=Panicum virgatum TaxID=38727 RepID=A0A8T0TN71_PANVG|nr:hypothetical protein PVAP13_4KG166810 [Panicum virgatum]